ncbi:MAG: hypothetical protein A2Y73_03370 [Chloroflexi bacterium RBG_13_56_8]|nr:MAG: hypothetical protein A2Y73_03370 [Chloroflexi bacterium RBG_13_56_8]
MEKPKVGVFVCHCGVEIGAVLNVPELVQYACTLPYVVFAQDDARTCTEAGLTNLASTISQHSLNRVVIASCTPRTHAPLFQDTCKKAGLNPHLFEFVNIRDQCAFVHTGDTDGATKKAKDLLRMGVASAAKRTPLDPLRLPVEPTALVLGGGVAGMTAALSLASRGYQVKLGEREPALGGLLKSLHRLYPTGEKASTILEKKLEAIENCTNIEVLTSATVRDIRGVPGRYEVVIEKDGEEREFVVGAIITATGAQEFVPEGMYSYDGEKVITQGQLERLLSQDGWLNSSTPESIVMIQCVGARDDTRPYCSRICCMTAVENAIEIKKARPSRQVYVLYRDMLTQGNKYEGLYGEARNRGVAFVQFDPESPPQVLPGEVVVEDKLLGQPLHIDADLVVLSTPLVSQPDAADLAQSLGVMVDEYGFLHEPHLKHRPLDTTVDGIFQCGSAHWPCDVGESVLQAYGAAARASVFLGTDHLEMSPIVAKVNVARCAACGLCEELCPYHAVSVMVVDQRRGTKAAQVSEVLCKGCGACAAACRSHAIDLAGYTNERVFAMIEAF